MKELEKIFLKIKIKERTLLQNNIRPKNIIVDSNTYQIISESANLICFRHNNNIKHALFGYDIEIVESNTQIITFDF